MEYTTLSNGVKAPLLGLGTFQLSLADTENAVCQLLPTKVGSL